MTSHRLLSRRKVVAASGLAAAAAAVTFAVPDAPAAVRRDKPRGGGGGGGGGKRQGVRLRLPEPTGPHAVGTVQAHLVDRSQHDPWQGSTPYRELMVSVWYPAWRTGGHDLAPHMQRGAAKRFDAERAPGFGVPSGMADWAATRTHAHEGAPPDPRAGRRPVLIYSPGTGDPRTLGTVLVGELASQGYVVVTVDHTHESPAVQFPDGSVKGAEPMLKAFEEAQKGGTVPKLLEKVVRVRVGDLRFVLDQLGRGLPSHDATGSPMVPLSPLLDLSRVGVVGQSGGGIMAAQGMYEDRRIRAGINMDGTLEYNQEPNGTHLMPVAEHGLDRPFLLMGSHGNDHTTEPSWRAFWSHTPGWHRDLTLRHSGHQSYTDLEAIMPQLVAAGAGVPDEAVKEAVGTVGSDRAVAAVRAYVTSFFDRWLRGRDDHLLDGPSRRHPDVAFVP